MSNKRSRGFTLIELLVVIAIIGILSTVVLAALNTARAKARDANRLAAVRQLETALAMYYADNGQYPVSYGTGSYGSGWAYSIEPASWENLRVQLAPYMTTLPTDPIQSTSGWVGGDSGTYGFGYFSGATQGCAALQAYMLLWRMEGSGYENPPAERTWCSGVVQTYAGAKILIRKAGQ